MKVFFYYKSHFWSCRSDPGWSDQNLNSWSTPTQRWPSGVCGLNCGWIAMFSMKWCFPSELINPVTPRASCSAVAGTTIPFILMRLLPNGVVRYQLATAQRGWEHCFKHSQSRSRQTGLLFTRLSVVMSPSSLLMLAVY